MKLLRNIRTKQKLVKKGNLKDNNNKSIGSFKNIKRAKKLCIFHFNKVHKKLQYSLAF